MPGAYAYLKQALLSRYTPTAIANCYKFINHPPLRDRHALTLFSDMQALLPADANILFNAHYHRRLPESMQNALVGKGELPPRELAEAAAPPAPPSDGGRRACSSLRPAAAISAAAHSAGPPSIPPEPVTLSRSVSPRRLAGLSPYPG